MPTSIKIDFAIITALPKKLEAVEACYYNGSGKDLTIPIHSYYNPIPQLIA